MKTFKTFKNRDSSLPFANYTKKWSSSNTPNMSNLTSFISLMVVSHMSSASWDPIKSSTKRTKNFNLKLWSPIALLISFTSRYLQKGWWNAWLSFNLLFFRWRSVCSCTFSSKRSCCCRLKKVGLVFPPNMVSLPWKIALPPSYQTNLEQNINTWWTFCIKKNKKYLKNKSKLKQPTILPLLNWKKSRYSYLPWSHRNEVI